MQRRASRAVITVALVSFAATALAHEDVRPGSAGGERLGDVNFPIACSDAAQREFNRGVAILHSFYFPDALKSFARVSELDPGCIIAY